MQHRNTFKNLLSAILESDPSPDRPLEWIDGTLDDDTARQVAKGYHVLWESGVHYEKDRDFDCIWPYAQL